MRPTSGRFIYRRAGALMPPFASRSRVRDRQLPLRLRAASGRQSRPFTFIFFSRLVLACRVEYFDMSMRAR